jgi:phospholipase C
MIKSKTLVVLFLVAGLVLAGMAFSRYRTQGRPALTPQDKTQSPAAAAGSPQSVDHIVVILEENKTEGSVIESAAAPYLNSLAAQYARASHYNAVTHPSLPNYIALTSGTTAGITNDCNPPGGNCQANVTNIADRIEASGRSWKEYAENMPGACTASNSGEYAVKHNPFMYYPDITRAGARCTDHVVPYGQLATDLRSASSLPDFVFITPDLCSDMHDCSVRAGDDWLSRQLPAILQSPAFTQQNSLLVITWDEGDQSDNNVPVVFAGPAARKGYVSGVPYSHYSLLHTIEQSWKLPPLTDNDGNAPVMSDMLK